MNAAAGLFGLYCALESGFIFLRAIDVIDADWSLVLMPIWLPLLIIFVASMLRHMGEVIVRKMGSGR